MNEIGVVHLVRAANGLHTFERFWSSYLALPARTPHDLILIFKGFRDALEIGPFLDKTNGFGPYTIMMSDRGYDLTGYGIAIRKVRQPILCFLNSFSEILSDGWLAKMANHIHNPAVGLVGSTGSWESMYTNARRRADSRMNTDLRHGLNLHLRAAMCRFLFDPFPNCHIRTNAFMVRRELAIGLWPGTFRTKLAAHLFENGKRSLTKRILDQGLRSVIVGRDGKSYEMNEWRSSSTFRSNGQANLLVSDNQTRYYSSGCSKLRHELEIAAWGD